MYINIKSKYKKILWLIFGFLLACCLIDKVHALDYNLDTGFVINNITIDYNLIDEIWSNVEGKTQHELNNVYSDTTYIYHRENLPYMYIQPTSYNNNVLIFFSPTNEFDNYYYWNNYNYNIALLNSDKVIRVDVGANHVINEYHFDNSIQINNSGGWYPQKSITSFDFYINNTLKLSKSFDYVTTTLPDYLSGYKEITLTINDKYYMLSGLSSGSVFIPIEDFINYGGRLSYYDNDLDSQPYDTYIQDYVTTEDGLYVRQDFNLADYDGADWVMFSKYIYLEGQDDISYSIWVPNDIYDSEVTITPNSSGGNTFDFDYKDSNGNIQNGQVDSVDLSQDSPLFNQFLSSFSQNTFGLASIITAPLSIIQSLDSSSCTPLNLPLPFIGGTLTLPCMYSFYQNTFGNLFTLYQTITFGIVSYWVCVRFLQFIKEFKDPDHDEIEVVDL